jgi:hypothetical protein
VVGVGGSYRAREVYAWSWMLTYNHALIFFVDLVKVLK